jgi:hypothetical protein
MRPGKLIALSLLLVGFGPFMCESPEVEQARTQLQANEPASALETLTPVTDDAAEVHLARGLAHLMAAELDEADGALDQAYRLVAGAEARGVPLTNNTPLRARIAFARGLAAAARESWADAQVEFGKALKHNPADEDARWNLELAWYKANPPCHLREDDHEPDDTRADAKPLDPEKASDRLLCPTNEDWYTLPVQAESMLYVRLKGEVVALEDDETREVTLSLFAPSDPDDKPIRFAKVTSDGSASAGYGGVRDPGEWRIRVAGNGRAEFKYGLEVEIVPPCPADDEMEDNDSRYAAKALPADKPEIKGLKACPGDTDWYQFEVPATEGRKVTIAFDPTRAPLRAALFAADGETPLAMGESGKGGLSISIPKSVDPKDVPDAGPPPPARTYLLEVATTTQSENNYALSVQPDDGESGKDKNDQDQKDDQDEKKDQDKKDEKKDQDKKDQKDKGGEQPKPEPKPPEPKPADKVDIDKLIDALDKHQRNPQLEKALRALPVVPRMEDY